MPLNPKVLITETGVHGHCWFAGEDFSAGEWIWKKRPDGQHDTHTTLMSLASNSTVACACDEIRSDADWL
jgi:hypothetical protein